MKNRVVTLKEIVEQKEYSELSCICGENHLNKVITGVHIIDNPDTVRFFRSGEVVMTTGYILKEMNEEEIGNFVRHLCERGCSGIIFKINRFYDAVPESIKEKAEEYDIPIVVMPYKYAITDIQNMIMKRVLLKDYISEEEVAYHEENDGVKEDFLSAIIAAENREELEDKSRKYLFDINLDYFCINRMINSEEKSECEKEMKTILAEKGISCHTYRRENRVIWLCGLRKMEAEQEKRLHRQVIEEFKKLENKISEDEYIGISEIAFRIEELKPICHQAYITAYYLKRKKAMKIAAYYENAMMFAMYKEMKKETVQGIYKETISPILEGERISESELLHTLESMVSHHWNMKETAEALYIHRNTLNNRREKMERLMEDSMGMEFHTAVQNGLYAYEILNYLY